jgi:glycosyltransferase involved in cell wall biosynthesis
MENQSSVTVIIPCFNSQDTVERAFNSVKAQTYPVDKIIFVDDASSDNTLSLLNKIKSQHPNFDINILLNERNIGPGLSRNLAWDMASTSWISFLDSDDTWVPNKNEIQINLLKKYTYIDFLSGECLFQDNQIHALPNLESVMPQDLEIRKMLFKNRVSTRTVILRKEIPLRFSEGLSEDFKLWLNLLNEGYRGVFVKIPMANIYRMEFSKGGISSKRTYHEYFELKAIFSLWSKYNKKILVIASLFSIVKYLRRQIIVFLRIIFLKKSQ